MFLIVLLATAALFPQEKREAAFQAGISLVKVDVQVSDRKGRPISGLRIEDFEVFDENQPRKITYFEREREHVDLLLLLDVSGSMRRYLEQMAANARAALAELHEGDRTGVMLFAPGQDGRRTVAFDEISVDALLELLAVMEHVLPQDPDGPVDPLAYISNPTCCPWCGGTNSEAPNSPQVDGPGAWQTLSCVDCGKRWHDIYQLTDFEQEGK